MIAFGDSRLLIVNPFASGVRRDVVARIADLLGLRGRAILEIGRHGSARDLAAQAVRAGVATIVAAGGDGTLHGIVQPLAGTRTRLGIIPLGTSNDLATRLAIPHDLGAACAVVNAHHRVAADLLTVNSQRVATVGGVGFPALVARDCNVLRSSSWGRRALAPLGSSIYAIAAAARVVARRPASNHFTIHMGGSAPAALRASAILFGVVEKFGGGIRLAPDGGLDLGTFAALTVTVNGRADLLATLLHLRSGRPAPRHARAYIGLTNLVIRALEPVALFGDGEWLGVRRAVRISLERRALSVLAPPRSALRIPDARVPAREAASGEALREAM